MSDRRGSRSRWRAARTPRADLAGRARRVRVGRAVALAGAAALAVSASAAAGGSGGGSAELGPGGTPAGSSCGAGGLALTDVLQRGRRVLLAGTAASSLAGQKVSIVFAGGDQVATALVAADGQFSTLAPLPPAGVRTSDSARYLAEIGQERSASVKLSRRLIVDPPVSRAGTVALTGEVRPPLTDPPAEILIERRISCSKLVRVAQVRPSVDGHFQIRLKTPADESSVTYQLTTLVRASAGSDKEFPTYGLPQTVALPPTVSSVEPAVGSTAGGTSVKITGSGFASGDAVTIGARATSVEVKSETEIVARTPAGSEADEVVVSGSSGTSRGGAKFTYAEPPTVASLSPAEGPTDGGAIVTIEGAGFLAGERVTIGGATATIVEETATSITAETGAAPAGSDEVVVTLPNGVASAGSPAFTYVAPPTVTAISAAEGPIEGGTFLLITGTGFSKGATVEIGDIAAAFIVLSATEIVAETAAGAPGEDEVVVSDEYGSSSGGPGFTYVTAEAG